MKLTYKVPASGIPAPWIVNAIMRSLAGLADRTAAISITTAPRSVEANKYYWAGVIRPIASALLDAGVPKPDEFKTYDHWVHESLAGELLGAVPSADICGREIIVRRSTTELNASEFYQYIKRICSHDLVVSMGVEIETPQMYRLRTGQKITFA